MPYLYSTPFFILIFLFMLCPFVLNIGISFTNYSMNGKDLRFVGIKITGMYCPILVHGVPYG